MARNEQAKATIYLDGKQAEAALDSLKKRATELRKAMKEAQTAGDQVKYKKLQSELKGVESATRSVRKETFDYERVLRDINGASMSDLRKALRTVEVQLNKMKRTDPGYATKAAQAKLLRAEMQKVNSTMRAQQSFVSRAADGFNKYFGMATAWIASITGIVLGMKRIKGVLDDFEETITNVYTLLDEADFEKYKNLLDEGSVEMIRKYGFEIKDVNKALFDTISAGVPAGESISFMNEAAVLAKGGVTSLSVSVDGMTSIMNAYGLEMDKSNQVSSAFFTAQKYGKTTVEKLASTVGAAVPIAAQAGVTYQELLSSVSALTTQGISTEMAMTAMKNALQSLLKPGAAAEKVLKEFGIPVGATEIRARGLGYTLERLNKVMEENPDAVSKAIPNIRGLTAVSALSGRGLEKYHEILQKVNADFGEGSSLMGAYTKQMETDVSKQKAKLGELNATILELGDTLRPVFTEAIRLSNWGFRTLLKVVRALIEHKNSIFSVIAAIAAYTAIIKMHIVWKKIYNTVTNLGTIATKGFNAAVKSNPLGLLLAGLTAVATFFVTYKTRVKEATTEQSEFNEVLSRSNDLLGQTKSLKERASVVKNLSKEQLETLKSDLEAQVRQEEDFHATLLQKLKKRLEEDEKLKQLHERRNQEGLTKIQQINLDAQINARKQFIARELEDQNKANLQRLKNLKTHLANVDAELKKRPSTEDSTGSGTADFETLKKALESSFAKEQNLLKQQLYEKKITRQAFNDEMYALELAHLTAMRELYQSYGSDVVAIEGQIIDKKLAWQQQLENMLAISTQISEQITAEERKMFEDIDKEMDKHLDDYTKNLDKETQATIEAEMKKKEAREKAKDAAVKSAVEAGAAAVENAESVEEAGTAILNSIRKQMKAYLAEFVATAAMKALKGTPFPLNIIAATVAGGAATFLFNKLIPEFYAGGSTGPGTKYEPAGIVHKNEYVIPQEGTENPNLKPIIDVIEMARQSGSLHRLDLAPIVQAVPRRQFASGGSTSSAIDSSGIQGKYAFDLSGAMGAKMDEKQNQVLEQLTTAVNQLLKWKPKVYTETIKKDLDTLNDIESKRGL